MGGGLVRADPAVVHQRLDQRVIVGDLLELPAGQDIGAGVTDVDQRHPAARPEHGRQRGAHAPDGRICHDHVMQGPVGTGYGLCQGELQFVGGHVAVKAGQRGDGHRAGDLARRVAAHAVGHREQARARVCRVLVPLTEETDVGADRVAECECHLRSSRTVLPIRIGTPGGTGVGWVTFCRSR